MAFKKNHFAPLNGGHYLRPRMEKKGQTWNMGSVTDWSDEIRKQTLGEKQKKVL